MINERRSSIAILIILVVGAIFFLAFEIATGGKLDAIISVAVGVVVTVALLVAYIRGWQYARHAAVILITLLVGLFISEPFVSKEITFSVLIPVLMAMIMLPPYWILITSITVVSALLIRSGFTGIYSQPDRLVTYFMVVAGAFVARLVTEAARQDVERARIAAEEALVRTEQQARELSESNLKQEEQINNQRRLLDLVNTLETPTIQLADGIIFAPLVGNLDSQRAKAFTARLLHATHEQRAREVIIDITGISLVDTAVARTLVDTATALRLLGCQVTISGISPQIAQTLSRLGITLDTVRTVRTPQDAIRALSETMIQPLN